MTVIISALWYLFDTHLVFLCNYVSTEQNASCIIKKKKRKEKKPLKCWETLHICRQHPLNFFKRVKLLGAPPFMESATNPRPCSPGHHREDVGFVGEGLFQPRTLGLNPRRLAAFGHSHFEGTVWDGHIVVCHLHHMEACAKQQKQIVQELPKCGK